MEVMYTQPRVAGCIRVHEEGGETGVIWMGDVGSHATLEGQLSKKDDVWTGRLVGMQCSSL